jgi:PAS domain S-box-containing protein
MGVNIDVTDGRQMEEALRDSEERFRLAITATNDAIWDVDLKTGTVSWNETYSTLYGRPRETSDSWQWWIDRIHPEDRERTADGLRRAISSGASSWTCEYRFPQADGRWAHIYDRAHIARDTAGAARRVIGAMQDLTERKRAEQALRESEQRFRNMADTAPVMIWVCGPDKRGTFFNKRCLDFTGHTMEEKLGDGWTAGLHPEDREQFLGTYSSSIDARQEFRSVFRLLRADGEYRWVLCTGVPRSAPDGIFAGYIGSCIDVTDQKRAEETLRRNLDEIAHLNRVAALGEMATSLAHELNQPLAAILTNAEAASRFLNRKSPNLARVRGCLTAIAADDERAAEVIKRLRSLLKKDQSQASLIDLNEVVSDALRLVNHDATIHETRVRIETHTKLAPVLVDRVQLCQVVLNLLVNGLQAAAEQPPAERWVLVRTAKTDGGCVELTVEDSGKGIAEGDLARVFEPFFTTKREGLGMGLSISQSIVQANGGRVWVENSARHGAVFHCVLPVAQQGGAAATT